jgi:hypothetical protein
MSKVNGGRPFDRRLSDAEILRFEWFSPQARLHLVGLSGIKKAPTYERGGCVSHPQKFW